MTKSTILLVAILCLFVIGCAHEPKESTTTGETAKSSKNFFINYPSDTINFTGADGKKHGIWLENDQQVVYNNDTAYPVTSSTIQEVVNRLNKQNGY